MITLWIGDFRAKQIQSVYSAAQQTAEYHYLTDNLAEYSWFKNNVVGQLPLLALENANITIMLGFVDCLYSCVWDVFDVGTIAEQYAVTINELVADYSGLNFYFCSVNPVEADYPFAESKNGVVTKNKLNAKIGIFNNTLKEKCKAQYIDSYDYLVNTSFTTRDGVRFTYDTCTSLHNYISANFKSTASAAFLPRLTAPDSEVDSYTYWTAASKGGVNPFAVVNTVTDSTLPSCEAYAWGRFYEILGDAPTLSTNEAKKWYTYEADGYKRGDVPKIGAIACWTSAITGFVAVVEQVRDDDSIITSESEWDNLVTDDVWRLTERTKGTDGNWGMSSYTFQGFIYCPATTPTASIGNLDKATVTAVSRALTRSEMEANAKYIWNYLGSKGWSLNAVAGMLGNMQYESTINPGRHQVGSGDEGGFGLVQWTPKKKLTDWLSARSYVEADIDGQLERIIWEKENGEQYAKNKYKYTFETFSTSLDNPYTLACAFAFDYERSWVTLYGTESAKETLRKERGTAAEEWYSFLAPFALDTGAVEEKFTLNNFKLDVMSSTGVSASFITRNGNNAYYMLLDSTGTELLRAPLTLSQSKNKLQIVSFNCSKDLIPNTSYTLKLQATGLVGENTITRSISFTTPQDLPASVKTIKLSCDDTVISASSVFKLDVEMPTTLGYWSTNSAGYEKLLIVNGKCIETKTINQIKNIVAESFTIKNEFNYVCKTADIIQIGIRIWVRDNNNKKIYDDFQAKASNAICLLNNSVQTFLNIK